MATCCPQLLLLLLLLSALLTSSGLHVDETGAVRGLRIAISPRLGVSPAILQPHLEDLFSNFSWALQTATHDRLHLGGPVRVSRSPHGAHVVVDHSAGPFDHNPAVLQPGGCRDSGRVIVLPLDFVVNYTGAGLMAVKRKTLAQAWLQYKYGLFSELGFPDDPRYPLVHGLAGKRGSVQVTECLGQPHSEDFMQNLNARCGHLLNLTTGRLNTRCTFEPDYQSTAQSSIMAHTTMEKVIHVCGLSESARHDGSAPTKHNALCGEINSPGVILSQHPDLQIAPPRQRVDIEKELPTSLIEMENDNAPQIVLIVSEENTLYPIRTTLEASISRFHMYDLNQEVHFGVVGFTNGVPRKKAPLSQNSKALSPAFTFQSGQGAHWVAPGLGMAIQMLTEAQPASMKIVVLIGRPVPDEQAQVEELVAVLRRNNIIAYFVVLTDDRRDEEGVFEMASRLAPERVSVCSTKHHDNTTDLSTQLLESFLLVAELQSWTKHNLVARRYMDRNDTHLLMRVQVPQGLASLEILLDVGMIADAYSLVDPRGDPKILEMPAHRGVFVFPKPTAGTWLLNATRPNNIINDVNARTEFSIMFLGRGEPVHPSITLESWTSVSQVDFNQTRHHKVKIFAHLHQGPFPVSGARLAAMVYHPNGSSVTLDLKDDGLGEPDTTQGDGIYSRHLSPHLTSTGLYLIVVRAHVPKSANVLKGGSIVRTELHPFGERRCCGSRVERTNSESPAEPFSLQSAAVSLAVRGFLPPLPPGRVADLRVEKLEVLDRQHVVTLTWTEPGGCLDYGIASEFIIKFFHNNREDIPNQFDQASQAITTWTYYGGPPPNPQGYGTPQRVSIAFAELPQNPQEGWHYPLHIYFALKTQFGNLTSAVSNIASVYLERLPPKTTTPPPSFTPDPNTSGSTTDPVPKSSSFGVREIYILVGSLLAFLALVVIVLVVLACRRKQKKQKKETCPPSNGANVIHTITSDINPIQAWPAEVLLDHYDRVQDAKMHNQAPPVLSLADVIDGISIATSSREGSQGGDMGSSRQISQV